MTSRLVKICIFSVQASAQVWTGGAPAPSTQCVPRADNTDNYEEWISAYRKGPIKGSLNDPHQIELSITVIDGDDLKPVSDNPFSCGMTTSIGVSAKGTVSMLRITSYAIQGGGPDQLPTDDLKTLRALIADFRAEMPQDHSRLPTPGRRVVLQVRKGSEILARVYDRADMPDGVLEILGLTGATHGPLTMDFTPARIGTEAEFGDQGIAPGTLGVRMPQPNDRVTKALRADTVTLAISPDGSLIVKRHLPFDGRLVVTDTKRSAVVYEERETTLNDRWIYYSNARFTPDGRFLLLLSNLPAISVYDTKTWQRVDALPGLPSGGVAYYPAPDWKRGLVVSRTGAVDLWDASAGRTLGTLDLDGKLQSVSFSPDESLFAVTSVGSTFHLLIWETGTGKFVRELPALYYFQHDVIGDPMWWGNGKYLLAETRESRWGRYIIGIWNTESGKFRGEFSGCEYSNDPFDVALSGQRLFEWCRDGKLLMWNVAAAIGHIAEFEGSLKR